MALVNIVIGKVGTKNHMPAVPAHRAVPTSSDVITNISTSVQSSAAPTDINEDYVAQIYTDTNMWITCGTNPTALNNSGRYMAAGERLDLAVPAGYKLAVIAAT